jgi:hypothetical protein
MLEKAFSRFASAASRWAGSPTAFAAVAVVVAWALSGPVFGFSDVWQLTINTGTTIITFLIVFLIQNSQNRDTKFLQISSRSTSRQIPGVRVELLPGQMHNIAAGANRKMPPVTTPIGVIDIHDFWGRGYTRPVTQHRCAARAFQLNGINRLSP